MSAWSKTPNRSGREPADHRPPTYAEDGALFAKPGTLISNGSAYSGQINGIKVLRVNQMLRERGITTNDLPEVYKHGHQICRGGDSGGPWIKLEAGGLAMIGWEDLDLAGAAQVMGCSRALMAVRLHRARIRMAKALQALEQADPGRLAARKHTSVVGEIR